MNRAEVLIASILFAMVVAVALTSCNTPKAFSDCNERVRVDELRWAKELKRCRAERDDCREMFSVCVDGD